MGTYKSTYNSSMASYKSTYKSPQTSYKSTYKSSSTFKTDKSSWTSYMSSYKSLFFISNFFGDCPIGGSVVLDRFYSAKQEIVVRAAIGDLSSLCDTRLS